MRPPSPIRRVLASTLALAGMGALSGCATAPTRPVEVEQGPPLAPRRPERLEAHGQVRVDSWYWLNQRDNPAVRAYLEAENSWAERVLAPVAQLREELYEEIVARIPAADDSVPVRYGGFEYWTRYREGADYPQWVRNRLDAIAVEVLLDGPSLDRGTFLSIVGVEPDPTHQKLAFAVDEVGRRIYTLRFRDLASGEMLADEIPGTTGDFVWANDGSVLYTTRDPVTLRADRVRRHRLGDDPSQDRVIAVEDDPTFSLGLSRSRSGRYLFIVSEHTLSSEWRLVDADHPDREPVVLLARERGHEYEVEHAGDALWIRTNDGARDFRLVTVPLGPKGVAGPVDRNRWQEVLPAREGILLDGISGFRDFLVLRERYQGQRRLRVMPLGSAEAPWTIELGPEAQVAWVGENREWAPDRVRIGISGLATPPSTYDYHLAARRLQLRKQEVVFGGFDSADYHTERLLVTARDGSQVPVSLVHRRDLPAGPSPLLLYAYGAYGISMEPRFNSARLSLLDRGFVFAIAHVRGGAELGRAWYENGRLEHKQNTFNDFVDVAAALIERGTTSSEQLFAEGRSAGGLLIGAVVNQRPELFRGAIAGVPFVDVVTTMLDETIPLTTFEYDEWGDPRQPDAYRRMLAYSPYDNVRPQRYPALLVLTGFHDSQVQYWEPAKWVARLRATKTGDEPLLFVTDLEAGHGGAAGRLRQHRDTALAYAFLVGVVEGKLRGGE